MDGFSEIIQSSIVDISKLHILPLKATASCNVGDFNWQVWRNALYQQAVASVCRELQLAADDFCDPSPTAAEEMT